MRMDVFGDALLSYYREGADTPLIVTRDDGWQDAHSPGLYFDAEPLAFERGALELVEGPTLDVGCGAGRHLKWLGMQGYVAQGIDSSAGAIEACHAQGLDAARRFDVVAEDLATLSIKAQPLLLFGNNIGIGGSFDGSAKLLQKLHTASAAGGLLLLTGHNLRETSTPEHLAYQERNLELGGRRGEMRLRLSYIDKTGPEFPWYHPLPEEIEELAALTGWEPERLELCGKYFWAALRRT